MNSWAKHVFLTVTAIPFFACIVPQQSGYHLRGAQQIDSLPATIIPAPTEQNDSILSHDTSAWILRDNQVIFSKNVDLKVKENSSFDMVTISLLNYDHLPNVDFWDIKLAVVDFGNINYLKQDF